MLKKVRKSTLYVLLIQFFVCAYGKSNALEGLLDKIVQNPTALQIDQTEKRQIELFYRAKPEETLAIIKSFRAKGLHIAPEINHFLLEIETISNYNLGNLSSAIQFNDAQLLNLQYFNHELADSLGSIANRMILFYTLEQPSDALSFALVLERKLKLIEEENKSIRLHKLLAVIYALLRFDEDAMRILNETIKQYEHRKEHGDLNELFMVKAFELLKQQRHEEAIEFLNLMEKDLSHQPFLLRRIYAARAELALQQNKKHEADHFFRKSFQEYQNFPDVISASQVLSDYSKLMMSYNEFYDENFLNNGLKYLKQYKTCDHLHFLKNLHQIELVILSKNITKDNNLDRFLFLHQEIDSLKNLINQNSQQFISQNLNYYYENEVQRISILELQRGKEKTEIQAKLYITIAVFLLFCLLFVLFAFKQIRKNQSNKILLESQAKKIAEEQLAKKKIENEILAIEQNSMQERLRSNLEQIEKYKGVFARFDNILLEVKKAPDQSSVVRIVQLFHNEFKDYVGGIFENEIKKDFKKNSPKKYSALVDKIGNENSYEFLFALLTLLDFNTKEISTSLNKSEKAVRSIRYRLRKLLELDREADLIEVLKNI
ncbi:MAG: hypothetical protein JJT77_05215 [Crocinitomicaceae bacterium]|nr:hypothetical protein [Crocinitomicaceae bacterium]